MNQHLIVASVLFVLVRLGTSLNNGLSRTPPMGWMSWTEFYCEIDCERKPYSCISEQLYKDQADRMVADGYLAAGYNRVHIDDCWMGMKRVNGKLISNETRFPSGITKLSEYMHERGMLLGIYEDYGTKTCGGYPGSFNYTKQDAQTFADWKTDYLKLDGCNVNITQMPAGYPQMGRDLNATGRPIVYSCSWPAYVVGEGKTPNYTEIAQSCNLWRNYNDVASNWGSVQGIIDWYSKHQDEMIPVHGPGAWNDPDMLVVGTLPTITVNQAKTQMSIWSIWSAPLIMSNDLRLIAPVFRDILLNKRVIAVDQDPLGVMGRMIINTTQISIYVKKMTPVDTVNNQYSFAVVFFNRNMKATATIRTSLSDLGMTNPSGYFVRDLWTDRPLGLMLPSDTYTAQVPSTGVVMLSAKLAQMKHFHKEVYDY